MQFNNISFAICGAIVLGIIGFLKGYDSTPIAYTLAGGALGVTTPLSAVRKPESQNELITQEKQDQP